MRNKKIICLLAAGLGALLLTGCGGENQKTYEQANADLEEANYDYALNEYQACISAGYNAASDNPMCRTAVPLLPVFHKISGSIYCQSCRILSSPT